MRHESRLLTSAAIATGLVCSSAWAAQVTEERLINGVKEPQNWLMSNQTYDNFRHSSLSEINRRNVSDLKAKFMFSIGGWATTTIKAVFYGEGKEEAVPVVEDGFMY